MKRRDFVMTGLGLAGSSIAIACGDRSASSKVDAASANASQAAPLYGISLAQWSLHRTIRSGQLDHMDFAATARREFGIEAVEYVNQFFADKAKDRAFLTEMKERADGEGVKSLLIMCDREGNLGSRNEAKRRAAVENHYKWVEAAKFLGCHSIRVNALVNSEARDYDEQRTLSAMGLRALSEFADPHGLNVIVENHGNLSSNGRWLSEVMQEVDHPRCGTLPDFGNFCIEGSPNPASTCQEWYDIYQGVKDLMPFAKAVSAKTFAFDDNGSEAQIDYERMLRIVLDAGYRGYVGVEYEGDGLSEADGVRATKELLERTRTALGAEYNKS